MNENLTFKVLKNDNISEISILVKQLNPKLALEKIKHYQKQMFDIPSYNCFGIFKETKLIGISSGWITIRFYSGKQLEVDNVIIDSNIQSNGYGKYFFILIEKWAKQNGCKTIELNTYVQNTKSHKFYFNLGYSILGFHYWKCV